MISLGPEVGVKIENSAPSVFEYLDVISYLQDYYKWRKATSKDFSYEFWSMELEFSSRSYIRMMIMGKKKVSTKFVETFSKRNFDDQNAEEYFYYLVQYSQAGSQKVKKDLGARLIKILKLRSQQTIIEPQGDFLSTPLLPRLYTLLGFKDITPTTVNLARLMGLSDEQTATFLKQLVSLELAQHSVVDGAEHWVALHDKFKIPDNKGNMNLMKFHERSLLDAIDAFEQPKHLRKYKSLLLPLTESELTELYTLLDDFATENITRYSPSSYQDRRLFQLNFNIHPVAESAEKQP
jgi:uncharacterized protein (TIGR02147 family)